MTAINAKAFFAESMRVQQEFKCRRSTADKIVAARIMRNTATIEGRVKTDKEILEEDIDNS